MPVHEDARDLAYYQPILMPDRVTMKPVECETEDVSYVRESRSTALARKAVTRTIM